MTILTYSHTLVAGTPEDINDVQDMFEDVRTLINGNLDDTNVATLSADSLTSTVNQAAGLNSTGTVRRGKSIIATEEVRTNVAYGTLTTPDQVSSVVLPTDGLIFVVAQGMFKSSSGGSGRAAIFVGANQLKAADANNAPSVQEIGTSSTANSYSAFSTGDVGLNAVANATAYPGDVTTGQAIGVNHLSLSDQRGGICTIFAAAGTYDISLQFKATVGSVTVKERKLWVWTMGF